MKRSVGLMILILVLLVSCAFVRFTKGNDVFTEINTIAINEGVKNDNGYEAYRKGENTLLAVVCGDKSNGSAILEYDKTGQFIFVVGYYPGNPDGEYLVGLFQSGMLVARENISKEKAEEIASVQLEKYKAGTKTTLQKFFSKKPGIAI